MLYLKDTKYFFIKFLGRFDLSSFIGWWNYKCFTRYRKSVYETSFTYKSILQIMYNCIYIILIE